MNIVVLDGYTVNPGDNPFDALHQLGNVSVYDRTPASDIVSRSKQADVLIINKIKLTEEILGQLPALKLIVVSATGYDCVDVASAKRRGVLVANVPEYGTPFVAQHAIALLLELCHRVGDHDRDVKAGGWVRCPDFSYWNSPMIELEGKTLGLFGVGRIGGRVAEIAHAMGMNVLGCSRSQQHAPAVARFAWVKQEELFAQADVISLHAPLTAETREVVNDRTLASMKKGVFLINTARGALINEQALVNALSSGQLAGAAVDVLASEPMPAGHPYLSAPNLIVTPHQAWSSLAARKRLLDIVVNNIAMFQAGEPINIVNR